mgnify:CR=1 FL=1
MPAEIPQNCTWVGGVSPADAPGFGRTCGEAHGRAKLTDEQVRAIRNDGGTVYGIAKKFGVSRRQVRRIFDGEQRREA